MFDIDKIIENELFVLETKIRNKITEINNKPINKNNLCYECSQLIDKRRLELIPYTQLCIECAVESDKQATFKKKLDSTRGIIRNMDT